MQATSQIPSDVVSEKAVLGVLLCSGAETLAEACAIIVPEDFFDPVNSLIFEHLRKMLNSGLPVELTSVAAEFRRCDLMRKIAPDQSDRGGAEFLCELVDGYGFDKANMRYYCRVIREKRQLRALIQLGQRMTAEAKAPMADADELLEHFGTDLYRLSVCEGDSALPKPIGVAVDAAILRADDIAAGRQSPGLMTGFKAIDVAMGGMQPGDLVVVAGPTSVGKTAYALTVVARAAKAGRRSCTSRRR